MDRPSDDTPAAARDPFVFRDAAPPPAGAERRRHAREHAARPFKLVQRGGRYVGGLTSNVSPGGALVCVERARAIAPGDEVRIAIDWIDKPVISESMMIKARVVRVTPMDHHTQAVALCYDAPAEAALAA